MKDLEKLPSPKNEILNILTNLSQYANEKIRQTSINAAGEIGIVDFQQVEHFFDKGLFDANHIIRNAVIGSVKKMGQKNPIPVIE